MKALIIVVAIEEDFVDNLVVENIVCDVNTQLAIMSKKKNKDITSINEIGEGYNFQCIDVDCVSIESVVDSFRKENE